MTLNAICTSNEFLWICMLIIDFLMALALYALFRKTGLYILIALNIVVCNIQVMKIIPLLGFTTTLGNVLYGSIYFATDMLGELYGKKEARRGVLFGFVGLVYTAIMFQLMLHFSTINDPFAVKTSAALDTLFRFEFQIVIASIIAYAVSQIHDVWAFDFLKRKTHGKHLWLRNNVSTLLSQAIDNTLFNVIAFYNWKALFFEGTGGWLLPFHDVVSIYIATYIMKIIIAVSDTPFLYIGRSIAKRFGEYTPIE